MREEDPWHIEIDYLLQQVRYAKEILGKGEADCAYRANKVLEPVVFRLFDLYEVTKGESK